MNYNVNIFVRRANELFGKKSQQEIANEIGISQTYVSSIKSGKIKSPGADTVSRIAEYYNVSADWLIGLSDCKSQVERSRETSLRKVLHLEVVRSQISEIIANTVAKCDTTVEALARIDDITKIFEDALSIGVPEGFKIVKNREVNANGII